MAMLMLLNSYIQCHQNEKAKKLIQSGNINWNNLDYFGWAPIHCAVEFGNSEILDLLLLQPNIDLNILTRFGQTVLELIAEGCNFMDPSITEEYMAEKLIKAGSDVTVSFRDRSTVLNIFIDSESSFYSFLIENGANVNAATDSNYTPLHDIIEKGRNLENVHVLLYHGADCDIKYIGIFSTFTWAIICNKYDIAMDVLYEYESDYLRNMEGITRENICEKLVEEMINNGVDFTEFLTHYSCFSRNLIINEKSFLKMWENIDKSRLLKYYKGNIVVDLMFNKYKCKYKCLIDLFSSESTYHLIADFVKRKNPENIIYFILYYSNLTNEQIITIIYIFLSCGTAVSEFEVFHCFQKFRRNFESINILLYVDIHQYININRINTNDFLFQLITNFDVDIHEKIAERNIRKNITYLLEIFNYCTPTKAIKELVLDDLPIIGNDEEQIAVLEIRKRITDKFEEINNVPSLLELSRNAARKLAYNSVQVKKCHFFHTAVDSFKIPDKMKELIKFKLPVNKKY